MAPTRHDLTETLTPRPSARGEDFDALADLFLEDRPSRAVANEPVATPRAEPQSKRAQSATPQCELVIPGHLPVLSGAWVVQFASRVAREGGVPVALVQLGAERTAIQILWPKAPDHRQERRESLRDAVSEARRLGVRWLIATDESASGALLGDSRLEGAYLLTAANEAATVAAYQSLRALWSELDRRGGARTFPIRLAIAGASHDEADRVCARIARAAGAFADQRVELAAAIERVGPTLATPIFESGARTDASSLLDLIERPPSAGAEPVRLPTPEMSVPRTPSRVAGPRVSVDRPVDPLVRPDRTPELRLVPLVDDPQLRPTPLRCPDAPSVEIGLDDSGEIHVLVNAGEESIDRAIRDAFIARGWLERQTGLVRLALGRPGDAPLTIRTHLFVASGPSARPLLDTSIRVRLLKSVTAQGQQFWLCEPLN